MTEKELFEKCLEKIEDRSRSNAFQGVVSHPTWGYRSNKEIVSAKHWKFVEKLNEIKKFSNDWNVLDSFKDLQNNDRASGHSEEI